MIVITVINWLVFLGTILLVRNKPKQRIEARIKVRWSHAKILWKKKYIAYNAVALSVFLGVSWNFIASCKYGGSIGWILEDFIESSNIAILVTIWVVSGGGFGIAMSVLMQRQLKQTGNFILYDRVCKGILLLGFFGYISIGILYVVGVTNFYVVTPQLCSMRFS